MENKKDILESISSVTKSLETGLELNNKSSVSQYYCDALNDKNINDVLGDADTHLITLVGFSALENPRLSLLCIILLCLKEKSMDTR